MARFGRMMLLAGIAALAFAQPSFAAEMKPKFEIDTSWPKPLPKNWILGQIGGIFVDKDDNVWITQRPRTVNDRDKRAQRGDKSICCFTAPSVIEFNKEGDVVQAWGGPETAKGFDWPANEHGIFLDYKGNIWFGGNGENDGMVLKFTKDGKFLMMIGKSAKQTDSKDQTRVGRAADMVVDPGDQRALRRRRLFQSPRRRVRRRHRRLQAHLGRLWQAADRREDHLRCEGAAAAVQQPGARHPDHQ